MDWEQGNGKLWEVDLSALRVGSVVVLWERVEGDVRPPPPHPAFCTKAKVAKGRGVFAGHYGTYNPPRRTHAHKHIPSSR